MRLVTSKNRSKNHQKIAAIEKSNQALNRHAREFAHGHAASVAERQRIAVYEQGYVAVRHGIVHLHGVGLNETARRPGVERSSTTNRGNVILCSRRSLQAGFPVSVRMS